MLFYSASNVYCVDNYCHVFLMLVKQYSQFGPLPVSEKASGKMPVDLWRFPFLIFLAAFF